jgi:hypothetical protein
MSVYLVRDRKCVTAAMTVSHTAVSGHTARIENLGYKLCVDSFFSSSDLFHSLCTKAINCCGTVRSNQKGMHEDFGRKLRLKWGDIMARVRSDWTAMVWKDKRNVNMLTNMRRPPTEGNFCDEHGNALKPAIVQNCNRLMGYTDMSDCMTYSYCFSKCTWK